MCEIVQTLSSSEISSDARVGPEYVQLVNIAMGGDIVQAANNLQHVSFGVYHFSILYGSNALGCGEHSGQRFLQSHFRQPPFAFPSCDFDE